MCSNGTRCPFYSAATQQARFYTEPGGQGLLCSMDRISASVRTPAQHPQTYYPEVMMALQARRGAQAAAARLRTGSSAHSPAAVTERHCTVAMAPATGSVTGTGSLSHWHGVRHRLRVRLVRLMSLRLRVASRPPGHPTHARPLACQLELVGVVALFQRSWPRAWGVIAA
jgi:hypothetical protein